MDKSNKNQMYACIWFSFTLLKSGLTSFFHKNIHQLNGMSIVFNMLGNPGIAFSYSLAWVMATRKSGG